MPRDCSFLWDLDLDGTVSAGDSERSQHAADFGTREPDRVQPRAVVFAESTADVSAVLAAANDRGVPVTPYAAGSGLEGAATPTHGAVSLDLTRMDGIRDVRPGDLQADVGPGVIGDDLDEAVARHGLFLPPLPSSADISTIGGMVATDASGMGTIKYGEVGDWVLRLEVVTAAGDVLELGSRARKTSSGYNLLDLVVGSEGTLGVVTEVTVRLAGRPEQVRGARATFPDLDRAAAAIADAVAAGVDLAKVELLDADTVRVANAYSDAGLPEPPTVFMEFHADNAIEAEISFCETLFADHAVERFEVADDPDEMAALWQARRDLAYALEVYDSGLAPLHPGDVTVPISRLPDLVRFAKRRGDEAGLTVPCFGHAGDGNVHYDVLVDPDDPEMVARGEAVYDDILREAIDLGGTVTGEHGIGRGKRAFLAAEHGPESVAAMRAVKDALDPNGILNPGAIFPEE